MFTKQKKVAYVVYEGRTRGLFEKWDECNASVTGYQGARFVGFYDFEEALASWEEYEKVGTVPRPRKLQGIATHQKQKQAGAERKTDNAAWIAGRSQEVCPCCGKPLLQRVQQNIT